jgi:glycogen debranching enzyme
MEIADLYRRSGEEEMAHKLERAANKLRVKFNRDFWVPGKKIYGMALEARNRLVEVVSSNPGQALWTGIADHAKARATADRLLQPDMFTGWGIRTLSSNEVRFNPVGYHLGTVWPHDNSIIAAGFRRYGLDQHACRVFTAIVEASIYFPHSQLPEAFAGFARNAYGVPVRYPVACHPQAWAAGATPFLLQTALGLHPYAFDQRLEIVRPVLPEIVHWVELRNLLVGGGRVDLRFDRQRDGDVTVEVLRSKGIQVIVNPETAARRKAGSERKVA